MYNYTMVLLRKVSSETVSCIREATIIFLTRPPTLGGRKTALCAAAGDAHSSSLSSLLQVVPCLL